MAPSMAGRNAGQLGWVRRFTALLTGISLLFASLEVTIPDVHDTDGGSEMTTRANPGAVFASASRSLPADHPTGPLHSHHVDHCSHSHADGVPAAVPALTGTAESTALPNAPEVAISSLPAAPHHPPPIV